MSAAAQLPELASVAWRPRVDAAQLRRRGRLWTAMTVGHTLTFTAIAVVLLLLSPLTLPVALVCLAKAWLLPELYAARGANAVRPRRRSGGMDGAQRTALGLLGDLVGHEARELHARTGLVLERGRLGVWLVGEAGAVLVRPGGRRVHTWCVGVRSGEAPGDLPAADHTAHLLLALRADEAGFATVANGTFSGARWRLRRRMPVVMRPALDAARIHAGPPTFDRA